MRTGVEQGDEKIAESIPAMKAPIYPLFLLLVIKFVDGIMLMTPRHCRLNRVIIIPSDVVEINIAEIISAFYLFSAPTVNDKFVFTYVFAGCVCSAN